MMVRIAEEKQLPFSPLVPNEKTLEAMREAEKGGLTSFETIDV